MRTVLTGIRLGGCPGLSEYSLGEQVILSCSSSLIFHNRKKCTEIVKYVPNIFYIAKYLKFSDDFCHILSYKRALCVTIALKW